MGGIVEKVVPRNTPIPVASWRRNSPPTRTARPRMAIHVVQGEREMVDRLPQPGALRASGHSADDGGRRAHPRHLRGRCRRAAHGVGRGAHHRRRRSASRSSRPMASATTTWPTCSTTAWSNAEADMTRRLLTEARVEARRSLLALDAALAKDGALLTPEERAAIDAGARAPRGGDGRRQTATRSMPPPRRWRRSASPSPSGAWTAASARRCRACRSSELESRVRRVTRLL